MKERVGVTHAEGDMGIVAQEVLEIEVRGAVITLRLGLLQTCRSSFPSTTLRQVMTADESLN